MTPACEEDKESRDEASELRRYGFVSDRQYASHDGVYAAMIDIAPGRQPWDNELCSWGDSS